MQIARIDHLNITVADVTNGTNTSVSTPLNVVDAQIDFLPVDQVATVGTAFSYDLKATGGTRRLSVRQPNSPIAQALLDVVLFWVEQGVRVFRVDNPHTKTFAFWEWLIAEVQRVGLRLVRHETFLRYQYLLVFERPVA